MLNSLDIEKKLLLRGFELEVDNTHARGFKLTGKETLIYTKCRRSKKSDPLEPVYEQPFVIHWSFKKHPYYEELRVLVGDVNLNYRNDNLRGFDGPSKSDKPHGIAVNIESSVQLDKVLAILGLTDKSTTAYEDITEGLEELKALPETSRQSVIDARLGQGKYRKELIEFWSGCSVTGLTNNNLLRASHIYPWKLSTHIERLDKFNGLLLTPNLDQAFDQGLISFNDHGKIIINEEILSCDELSILKISKDMSLRRLNEKHQHYLQKHRNLHGFEK